MAFQQQDRGKSSQPDGNNLKRCEVRQDCAERSELDRGNAAKKDVEREPDREIGDNTDNSGRDCRQSNVQLGAAFEPINKRCTCENPNKAGDKRDPKRKHTC